MEEKKRSYQWFVEPKNDFANEMIGKELVAQNEIYTSLAEFDDQGIPHQVYQAPNYAFITRLYKSKLQSPSDFAVFQREGSNGPIRFWALGGKKKRK
jgi:hypothetical protein